MEILDGRFMQIQQHRHWRDFEPCGLNDVVNGVRRVTLVDGIPGERDYFTLKDYDEERIDRADAVQMILTGIKAVL
jgi:hypothetical protein